MTDSLLFSRLQRPTHYPLDVVLDTDTFNEIDDQYALAYLLTNTNKLSVKAICAAPFSNKKASTPEIGMELSYNEIIKVLTLLKKDSYKELTIKGSKSYLPSETQAVESPATRKIVELAINRTETGPPLYIIAIGAITNVASAILLEPKIIDKIVLVWLGGHSYTWPTNDEFNMMQDVAGARVVFGCGVPVIQIPCMGVVSAFATTGPELDYWIKGKNDFCDYIVEATEKEAALYKQGKCWSRAIWDVTAVAWLLSDTFQRDCFKHSPICQYDNHYSFDDNRHLIRYVYSINRDILMNDMFNKISKL